MGAFVGDEVVLTFDGHGDTGARRGQDDDVGVRQDPLVRAEAEDTAVGAFGAGGVSGVRLLFPFLYRFLEVGGDCGIIERVRERG